MLLRMNSLTGRRYFILAIWSEPSGAEPDVWRGYVETPNGARTYFGTLERLAELLREMGWRQDAMVQNQSSRRNLFNMES